MKREHRTLLIQGVLFITTLITTTIAGAEWTYGKSVFAAGYGWSDFASGFSFSVPFLLILTTHELGHYFTARYHSISVTLPYYIPLPPPLLIGTLGAVIRFREKVYSKRQSFDIGIAGPLAGFAMTLAVLFYGFKTLPEPEYIFEIHPEYEEYGLNYANEVYNAPSENVVNLVVGRSLLYLFFENFVADPARVPNPHEIYHYPLLFAGLISLLFTSLNLLPIGQLDGGHVLYGLVGYKGHRIIASVVFIALLYYAALGVIDLHSNPGSLLGWIAAGGVFLYLVLTGLGLSQRDTAMYAVVILASLLLINWQFPDARGYSPWLLFVFIIGRFIGVPHPPAEIEEPLDAKRIVLALIALVIFVISFVPAPIEIS